MNTFALIFALETDFSHLLIYLPCLTYPYFRYRHKFHRPSHSRSAALPKITARSNSKLNNLFESSTWRVMRHIRSVDVRNKYPLPKANPDEYFRNSTVFHVAGRVPNSTFLLHPEWV